MKDQKLEDVMNDTKLYLMKYFVESNGKITDDERDSIIDLMSMCKECLDMSLSIMKLDRLKNELESKGL